MISFLFGLALLTILFGIGFKVTGAILAAAIWLFIKAPIAFILCCLGLALCCTILLIPLGTACIKCGLQMLIPIRL